MVISCKSEVSIKMREGAFFASDSRVSLVGYQITSKSYATIEIDCTDGKTHWASSQTKPSRTSNLWTTCSGKNEVQVSLDPGLNNLKFWFKNARGFVSNNSAALVGVVSALEVELVDPSPGISEGDDYNCFLHCSSGFGKTLVLKNGNILTFDPRDDSVATSAGAMRIYHGLTGLLLQTISGDNADDYIGYSGVTELANGNIVIRSSSDDVGGVSNTGSVMIVNTSTGSIVRTYSGAFANSYLGNAKVIEHPIYGGIIINSGLEQNHGFAGVGKLYLAPID